MTCDYEDCIDGANEIAGLCAILKFPVMELRRYCKNEFALYGANVAAFMALKEIVANATSRRDQVELIAIACRSLLPLIDSAIELYTKPHDASRLWADLVLDTLKDVRKEVERVKPLAEEWLCKPKKNN